MEEIVENPSCRQYYDNLRGRHLLATIAGKPDYGFPTIDDDAQHIGMVSLADVLDTAAVDDV